MRCAAVSDTIALGPSRNGGYKKMLLDTLTQRLYLSGLSLYHSCCCLENVIIDASFKEDTCDVQRRQSPRSPPVAAEMTQEHAVFTCKKRSFCA
jgi:hypothetical protein